MKIKSQGSIRSLKCRQSPSFQQQDWVQISCPPSGQYGCGSTWFTAHHKCFTIWGLNDCCFCGKNAQFCSHDCKNYFHNSPHFWMGWSRQGPYAWFDPLLSKNSGNKIIFQSQRPSFSEIMYEFSGKKSRPRPSWPWSRCGPAPPFIPWKLHVHVSLNTQHQQSRTCFFSFLFLSRLHLWFSGMKLCRAHTSAVLPCKSDQKIIDRKCDVA